MASDEWVARAAAIAGDRDAGAGEILARLVPLLDEARRKAPAALPAIEATVRRVQPAMANLRFACAAAVADRERPGTWARAVAQLRRAPAALARVAVQALVEASAPPWRLVTWSYSSAVVAAVERLAGRGPVTVLCGEGRPRGEGRRLAVRLVAAGARVTLTTDAAVTARLAGAMAVVVGADAVTPAGWINKVGTGALAAIARREGVPVYVLASRDKFRRDPGLRDEALAVTGELAELGEAPGLGVEMANPTFEWIPLDAADLFLTDAGPVPAAAIGAG